MKIRFLLLALLASLPFAIQAQKISTLPAAAALNGPEIVPMTQNGVTVGASATQIANFIGAATNDLNILGNWTFNAASGPPVIINSTGTTPLILSGIVGTAPTTVDTGQLFSLNNSSTAGGDKRILGFGQIGANAFIRPILSGSGPAAAGFAIITGSTSTAWTANGNMTVNTPVSGVALTVTGGSSSVVNFVNNSVGAAALVATLNVSGSALAITSPSATSSNVFSILQSGQSAWALNDTATANLLQLFSGASPVMTWAPAGNVTVAAPTSGTAMTVNGLSGQLASVANQPVGLQGFTVSTLPTCNATLKGGLAYVVDATTPTYNAALTGGGAVIVPVFCNGTSWSSH